MLMLDALGLSARGRISERLASLYCRRMIKSLHLERVNLLNRLMNLSSCSSSFVPNLTRSTEAAATAITDAVIVFIAPPVSVKLIETMEATEMASGLVKARRQVRCHDIEHPFERGRGVHS